MMQPIRRAWSLFVRSAEPDEQSVVRGAEERAINRIRRSGRRYVAAATFAASLSGCLDGDRGKDGAPKSKQEAGEMSLAAAPVGNLSPQQGDRTYRAASLKLKSGNPDDRLEIEPRARISIETRFNPVVGQELAITELDQPSYSNRIVDVMAAELFSSRASGSKFELGGALANNGHNIIITQYVEPNGRGKPYRLILAARQGARLWVRAVERGAGRERPELENAIAGEEGPRMRLNQRLAASLPMDSADLARLLVEYLGGGASK